VEEEAVGAEDLVPGQGGDPEADRPPGEGHDGEVDQDLRHSRADVLLPREADLEQQEARLHEEHQHARHHHPGGVEL
jgi:hypothetical protein